MIATLAPVLTTGPNPRCRECNGDGLVDDDDERVANVQCDCIQRNAERTAQMLYNLGDMIDRWLGISGDGAFTPAFELAANGVTAE
jgi:hypothetical protein